MGSDADNASHVRRACTTDSDLAVFNAFLLFNRSVLKTNLYRPHKTALSFRLDPSFLSTADYPDKPFGVFFIVGSGVLARHAVCVTVCAVCIIIGR